MKRSGATACMGSPSFSYGIIPEAPVPPKPIRPPPSVGSLALPFGFFLESGFTGAGGAALAAFFFGGGFRAISILSPDLVNAPCHEVASGCD